MTSWPDAGLEALRPDGQEPVAVPHEHGILSGLTRGLWNVACGSSSYVLKVVAAPEDAEANAICFDPAHPAWWRREPLAYSSGALHSLPGVVVPQCVAIVQGDDESVGMLLEAFDESIGAEWPFERYALAARHFGEMNAACLTEPPRGEWVHPGCLRAIEATYPRELEVILREGAWDLPEVRAVVGPSARRRLVEFAEVSGRLIAALEARPFTFCHLDSSRPNLFALPGGRTGVVDWSVCGRGPLGEEMVSFVWGTANQFRVPIPLFRELERDALDGYVEGLAAAGCTVSADDVRFVYAAATCVHWLLDGAAMLLGIAARDGSRDWILRVLPKPVEDHLELRAAVLDHCLGLWDAVSRSVA